VTVEGMVGIALDQHLAAGRRARIGVKPWRSSSMRAAVSMRMMSSGWFSVGPRRGSELIWVDQFAHRRLAVAGRPGDHVAAVGGDQLAADDQQAMLGAGIERSTMTPLPSIDGAA
jgi:hypothetical protein